MLDGIAAQGFATAGSSFGSGAGAEATAGSAVGSASTGSG
jgi:hypothetical protein